MDYAYPNLCQELNKAKVSTAVLARILNIPEKLLYDKMSGSIPWSLSEAVNICRLLNTSNVRFLFLQLNDNLQYLESQERCGGFCRNV